MGCKYNHVKRCGRVFRRGFAYTKIRALQTLDLVRNRHGYIACEIQP